MNGIVMYVASAPRVVVAEECVLSTYTDIHTHTYIIDINIYIHIYIYILYALSFHLTRTK